MQYSVGVTVYRVEKGPFRDGDLWLFLHAKRATNPRPQMVPLIPVPKWLEAEIVLV